MRVETTYFVVLDCPADIELPIRDLLDRVEKLHRHLEIVLSLGVRWPHPRSTPSNRFTIMLSPKDEHAYGAEGHITIFEASVRTRSADPAYFNHGLFHETVHGILEGFGHQKHNHFPGALAGIVQVEALRTYAADCASDEADKIQAELWGRGYWDTPGVDTKVLWDAYRQHGFDDFRKIIEHAGENDGCLLAGNWKQDWNTICQKFGLRIAI